MAARGRLDSYISRVAFFHDCGIRSARSICGLPAHGTVAVPRLGGLGGGRMKILQRFWPLPFRSGEEFWNRFISLTRRPFAWPHQLKEVGVLGINHRNMAFIQETNPRALYPRVDD